MKRSRPGRAVAQSEPIWGLITPEPRTLGSTEGKLIFILSVPPAGRAFPARVSPEEEGQGLLGSKTGALALSSPEWVFEKDVDRATLLFCSWEGGSKRALHPLPSIPLKGLEPQCLWKRLPSLLVARLNSPCSRALCFSQILGKGRVKLIQQSLWLQSCRAPWTGTPSLTHPGCPPPFLSLEALSQHPGLETPCREQAKHSWGGSLRVTSMSSSVSRAPLLDRNHPALLINTCQQCPNLESGGGVLTYFSVFIITWLHLSLLPVPGELTQGPKNKERNKQNPNP